MCGRYALGIRGAFVRYVFQQHHLPVDDAPEDDATRETYNFAPGYSGLVYRADTPVYPAQAEDGESSEAGNEAVTPSTADADEEPTKYKLQAMKWGLIPSWTKRNPDYATLMKTINCRDDSLLDDKGMWTSMKRSKRCVVIAQGFYEWLKKNGGKEKIPHFVKRKDGDLMLFAGLWDFVQYEGSKRQEYTYSLITTDVNKQLSFLHDRMPVIFDMGSEAMWKWLDPKRTHWSGELQSLLNPYGGELECYAVSKDVGKVGNNSPNFIIPVASTANKQNIANFFNAQKQAKAVKDEGKDETTASKDEAPVGKEEMPAGKDDTAPSPTNKRSGEDLGTSTPRKAIKLESELSPDLKASPSTAAPSPSKTRSATSNGMKPKAPAANAGPGNKKITSFFAKS